MFMEQPEDMAHLMIEEPFVHGIIGVHYKRRSTDFANRRPSGRRTSQFATTAVLRRIGRTLGAALGTGPDDDPLLRTERRESRAEGLVAGRTAGHAEGRAEARVETQREAVLQVLKLRGLPVSAALSRHLAQLQGVSSAALVEAALHCRDEDDFLRRTRRKHR